MQQPYQNDFTKCLQNSVLSLAVLAAIVVAPKAYATENPQQAFETEFDTQAINSRGVDPSLAELFRHAPRFLPGENSVTLTVNGSARGKITARFDNNGQLCADKSFQKQAGLLSPPSFSKEIACFDLKTAWPQTELNLDPGAGRVDLVLPLQAVANPGTESGNWHHGGVAGMLNYDGQYLDSAGSTAGVTFMQLASEAGLNVNDWIIRSRQTFSRFNGVDTMQHQAAYTQRTFTDSKQVLQAGQVSLSNSMFGTGQVMGFQMFPEAALQGSRGGPGLVEGIADSQSVVEIRQSGVLVHSTTVPAGPFRLQGFSLLNTRSDLEVTMTGSNGERRQFTVPASALLLNGNTVAPGLSIGVGKLDQEGSSESPLLATIANGWVLNPHVTLNAGLLGSAPYRASAVGLDTQPWDSTLLSLQGTFSEDAAHDFRGASLTASLTHNLSERVSVSVNASQQTDSYRELNDALQDDDLESTLGRSFKQVGVGLGWSTQSLGSLSLSMARSTDFNGESTDYMRGGWSKQFGQVYVAASLEQDTGTSTMDSDTRFYLTVNIPFGSRSVSSWVRSSNNSRRAGVRYSDRSSRDRGWSLSSEQDFLNQRTSTSGTVDMVTPVSQLSGSLSRDSDNYSSWSARATGAVVAHEKGFTLSPYRVEDTFGIAKVGEEGGVKLDTPSGPTWTDSDGNAVLPSLNGFKRSSIQVDTRSLAKNVDIANAYQETEAARGSVNYVNFDVVRTRRVLVDVKDDQGKPLPRGASVFNETGGFVTVVGEKGIVFISDAGNGGTLEVQSSGNTLCTFFLSLPYTANGNELYETASAQCR
ncbi:fimbria/pilus outer membrane usher protein [Pseudomonas sp. A34-9]|uniref:fimbria/pilus outer membrane usher protein n=1 Tax=Pseudomonas sp. A34-9 TaxID=3034675 RepID=UPI00240D3C1C|nr:fimbria/pilus outer membrane usher protein [Pseudomonas sp. A34-9]